MNQKIPLIATTVAILLMMAIVPVLPALASSDSNDDGPSCSPITGNPYQEKCGETTITQNPRGECIVRAPEDTVTHKPNVGISVPC
jgi:hypothetical protein